MGETKDIDLIKEQAIELVEILEIMPDDVGTLNSLVFTFLDLDNLPKAENYALKLVVALDEAGDHDMVPDYINQYIDLAPQSKMFKELVVPKESAPSSNSMQNTPDDSYDLESQLAQLEEQEAQFTENELVNQVVEGSGARSISVDDLPVDAGVELDELTLQLSAELELADFLKGKGAISDQQAEMAVSTLIENRSLEYTSVPLTFLNELSLIEHVNMEKVLSLLSRNECMPFIKVRQFKVSDEVKNIIPPLTAKKLGVVVFSTFKGELMMAISNPLDIELKQGLEDILNKKIHFYLTSPDEINHYYNQ
ncbi:MAG: hypothetical protein KAG98_05000 [Lentisphaeria bacterium]|nr:hypothetical protein [Lentisphaeria bacterium]